MNIDKQYPCVAYMETAAKQRIPDFVRDYLYHGISRGVSVRKNVEGLDSVPPLRRAGVRQRGRRFG